MKKELKKEFEDLLKQVENLMKKDFPEPSPQNAVWMDSCLEELSKFGKEYPGLSILIIGLIDQSTDHLSKLEFLRGITNEHHEKLNLLRNVLADIDPSTAISALFDDVDDDDDDDDEGSKILH